MAATGNSYIQVTKSSSGFTAVLISAACEWFLIFLLLVEAILSYLLTRFASYCKLQAPCILCSRIDHLLGNEKPEFYQHLLCSNHRSEISSLISCHVHGKLAGGSGMCEDCLLSFTMKNNSSRDTHRLLVGILGMDLVGYGFQSPLQNEDFISSSMGAKLCSCCNKPWRSRKKAQRVQQFKLPRSGLSSNSMHLPHLLSHSQLSRRQKLKKMRDKFPGSETSHQLGKSGFDPLLHVGYSKLKITSDSEYEVPFTDYHGGGCVTHKKSEPKEDFEVQCTSKTPTKTLPRTLDLKQPTHHDNPMSSLVDPCVQPDVSQPQEMEFLASGVATDHGLSELNWLQVNQKFEPFALPELISLDDISKVANAMEVSFGESTKGSLMLPRCQRSDSVAPVELISLDESPPSVGASTEKYATGTSDLGHVSINENEEVLNLVRTASGTSIHADQIIKDPAVIKPSHLDPGDVCKWVTNGKETEVSDIVAEQPVEREIDIVNEELKLLRLHNSSAQQIILSSSSTSLVVHGCDKGTIDIPSSNGTQTLQKSVSVESGLESLDASSSEIEGENLLDKLKQQVDKDRKCIRALYKELEEERNASEIAANQAMAMITRLQDEKAALHMEALQYLRMMEEQAEYDVEALEKANDLLAEKEKEIQDLEAEVEFCRSNFHIESMAEIIHETSGDLKEECVCLESTNVLSITDNTNVHCKSMMTEVPKSSDKPLVEEIPCLEFEEEKLYISLCLKNMERKLHQFSCDRTLSTMPNGGGHSEKPMTDINDWEESFTTKMNQSKCQMEDNGSFMEKDLHIANGSPTSHEGPTVSNGVNHFFSEGSNFVNSNGEKHLMHHSEIDFVALGNEILDLNERLQALEADNDFLEQSLNSLQNGSEGLQFVQEIAHQLQELRKIGIRLRCQSIT